MFNCFRNLWLTWLERKLQSLKMKILIINELHHSLWYVYTQWYTSQADPSRYFQAGDIGVWIPKVSSTSKRGRVGLVLGGCKVCPVYLSVKWILAPFQSSPPHFRVYRLIWRSPGYSYTLFNQSANICSFRDYWDSGCFVFILFAII